MKLNNNICNHLLIRSCLQPECLLASKTEYLEVLYTIETWKNDHTSNGKLNSLAVLSMNSERVNELEWNNRPIKVFIHGVRMKSSTQQKVSQLFQNCKYLPEISNSTTLTIPTRDPKAVWKYS